MAENRLLIKRSAAKDIEAISRKADRRRIVQRIQALADDPRPSGAKRLSGSERYRLRQRPYRNLYEIEDDRLIVVVVKIGHRKDVYKAV